jgi:phosphomannomutase
VKKLVAFDLDGTLAESKQPIGDEMAGLLKQLLDAALVAVISGGDWPQFEKQVIKRLPAGARLERLFIMPTTGAKLYRFEDDAWHQIYAETFSMEEHDHIITALDAAVKACGFDKERTWGRQIEDRGSQITFSALGQEAPLDAKVRWDPDTIKRRKLQEMLGRDLLDLSVKVGGSTSIDITRAGVDKAYAIRKLSARSGVRADAMLFLGDALYSGGNDEPVRLAGFDAIAVRDVRETMNVVRAIVGCLAASAS